MKNSIISNLTSFYSRLINLCIAFSEAIIDKNCKSSFTLQRDCRTLGVLKEMLCSKFSYKPCFSMTVAYQAIYLTINTFLLEFIYKTG